MAYPQIASRTIAFNDTGNQSSHTVDMPSGIVSGNLLVAAIVMDGSRSADDAGFPAGWTEFFANNNILNPSGGNTAGVSLNIAYRIATGSEGSTITYTTNSNERGPFYVARINAWHGTTPPEAAAAAGSDSVAPNPASLSPSWGAEDTLWLAFAGKDVGNDGGFDAYPTNYTNGEAANDGTVGGAAIGKALRELNAASEDPGAFNISPARPWVATVVAIRPAAGGAPDPVPAGRRVMPQLLAH